MDELKDLDNYINKFIRDCYNDMKEEINSQLLNILENDKDHIVSEMNSSKSMVDIYSYYKTFLLFYIEYIISNELSGAQEKKLEEYYNKACKEWQTTYIRLYSYLKADNCKLRHELLETLKGVRDRIFYKKSKFIGDYFFIYVCQKLMVNVCSKHTDCIDFLFIIRLVIQVMNGEKTIDEAMRNSICYDSLILIDHYQYLQTHIPKFKILGVYTKKDKPLIYLDTNIYIDLETCNNSSNEQEGLLGLVKKSKVKFDYYYSPSHIEDIQKRNSKYASKDGFIDIINSISDRKEIHRFDKKMRISIEDAKVCDKRIDNDISLDITNNVENIKVLKIKNISNIYPQYNTDEHRRTINDKDLIGKDKELLITALKYVDDSFDLDNVKSIFDWNIEYELLNGIIYNFINALDILNYWSERNNNIKKINSSTHDTEHIIYACYADYFVTSDIRLWHRAKIIFGWIAPNIIVMNKDEFISMITDGYN